MADLDHKQLAAQIISECDSIKVFAEIFGNVDDLPRETVSKLQRCRDHIDQALIVFNEPN